MTIVDQISNDMTVPDTAVLAQFDTPWGDPPNSCEVVLQTTPRTLGLGTEKAPPGPDESPRRRCRKCKRRDRPFRGRSATCTPCQATSPRLCGCGCPLEPHKRKCATCRLQNDPASSQCPFCLAWYLTHRGMAADRAEIARHAARRCTA